MQASRSSLLNCERLSGFKKLLKLRFFTRFRVQQRENCEFIHLDLQVSSTLLWDAICGESIPNARNINESLISVTGLRRLRKTALRDCVHPRLLH
jgi:hypothetical protein